MSKIQTKTKHSPIYLQPCSNQKQFVSLPMLNSTPSGSALGGIPIHILYIWHNQNLSSASDEARQKRLRLAFTMVSR